MGKQVMVRDMKVDNMYKFLAGKFAGQMAILKSKRMAGAGGSGGQEPYYELIFKLNDDGQEVIEFNDWDTKYEEVTYSGGEKRRTSRRSPKSSRKSGSKRRHKKTMSRRGRRQM